MWLQENTSMCHLGFKANTLLSERIFPGAVYFLVCGCADRQIDKKTDACADVALIH